MATFEGREEQIVKKGDLIQVANELNWVPVSKRNPDEEGTYLVTRRGINHDTRYMEVCLWYENKWFDHKAYRNLTNVIAWAENTLKPYEGD